VIPLSLEDAGAVTTPAADYPSSLRRRMILRKMKAAAAELERSLIVEGKDRTSLKERHEHHATEAV